MKMKSKGVMAMENKLEKIGQNNFMDNFVKTDDILKDMCGIIEFSQNIRLSIHCSCREIG